MISPEEIKKQALGWWKFFLQSHISGEVFFPKTIDRIGKVKSGQITGRFEALQQEIDLLYRHSKDQTGSGYTVKTSNYSFRRTGEHELPESLVFETAEDYLSFTGKRKEWRSFLSNYELLSTTIPALKKWSLDYCLQLTDSDTSWNDIIKVCRYFLSTPRPDLYIRQLPLEVHTKFIEDNAALIQSLLDFLIPDHIRNAGQKRFADRYFLKHDEPLIRIRMLDPAMYFAGNLSDISIPLSDFKKTEWPAEHVLITENKMNFLTLPVLSSTISLWSGGGFNISYLKDVEWLQLRKIFYWGDIDEHGFQILHQLRSYYPQAKSIMMDRETFENFQIYTTTGSRNKAENLALLSTQEAAVYEHLRALNTMNRLEQEKLPQAYVDEYLKTIFLESGIAGNMGDKL